MEDIIAKQNEIQISIQKLASNFKKDSAERKTDEYIKRRIECLDSYWVQYQNNHLILNEKEDRSDHYFTEFHYDKTENLYKNTKQMIINYKGISERPGTSVEYYSTPQKHQGVNSKTDDLLKKQYSNFRAFQRTVRNINVDSLKEKWEYEDLLNTIQSRWAAIDSLHWELDSELEGSNQAYEEKFTNYEQIYSDIKKSINSKIWSTAHKEKLTPQMEIPIFSGTYHQWTSFKDLFTEVIHSNSCISNAQKMQFLKSKVRGEAERLIQHLSISAENYTTCWDILNHRYNNKKLIFSSHVNILLNLPVMQQISINQIKRLHDTTLESINAIKNLGIDVSSWDPLLVHILSQKLDQETHSDYLESLKEPRELPKLQDFLTFLESKFTTLESSRKKPENNSPKFHQNSNSNYRSSAFKNKSDSYNSYGNNSNRNNKSFVKSLYVAGIKCQFCNNNEHGIFNCEKFLAMPVELRFKTVKELDLCTNCLYKHNGKQCSSLKRCRICNGKHNSILHDGTKFYTIAQSKPSTSKQQNDATKASNVSQGDISEILLATALIKVTASDGTQLIMRALIDQGSQLSLISENAAQRLSLKRNQYPGVIYGVGEREQHCKGRVTLSCQSLYNDFTFSVNTFIMNNLVKNLPNRSFQTPSWDYLKNIQLADPQFNISRSIDILLGADIYSIIILNGIIKGEETMQPTAQLTKLGWILSGSATSYHCNIVQTNIDDLRNFWEIEDIEQESSLSSEDLECVQFYKRTTERLTDGKYRVKIPLKSNFEKDLGNSKAKAVAQFGYLERKLLKNENLSKEYKLFINEYIELGHMKQSSNTKPSCYLPHHCVVRDDSTTTSLRVVFNASSLTSSGLSLNDLMYKGPNLQQNLQLLILKWRQYKIAFTADIEKMFRNIWMHEDDQNLQKIVWRDDPKDKLQEYQLTTVTYGLKAAPFLAMMTLRQLANDERDNYQEAAKIIEQSFYMDDLLHGAHTISSAKELQRDLINLLKSGGFNLRKWVSNNSYLLQGQINDQNQQSTLHFKQPESRKTLGLQWNPTQDTFTFTSKLNSTNKRVTKRSVLSDISKFFDPLGWLTPITTQLKILFQTIWLSKINWDEEIPENIHKQWIKIKEEIPNISKFTVPRWLGIKPGCSIELHGFCDSSSKSYACVIYCKIKNQPTVTIVAGKARLLPSSKTLSMPRSELCGALLLVKLMSQVKQSYENYEINVYGWIDSTAVLGWLNGDPGRWKTFVANRIRQITDIMPSDCWNYVSSEENPADCATRGLLPSQLINHPLWWQGPAWLSTFTGSNANRKIIYSTQEEIKTKKQSNVVIQQNTTDSSIINMLLTKYSSFTKVIRTLAWVYRFISRKQTKRTSYITLEEYRMAMHNIIKHVQADEFAKAISDIQKGLKIDSKSKILSLNPILDENGILRVGGRLRHAHISTEMQHPIIIPHRGRLTDLIIHQAHTLTFHGGARTTLSFIRQKYWIIGGNVATKKQIRLCIKCRKINPYMQNQIMGDLPESRSNPSRPFSHCGVDFTGHVYIKASKGRGIRSTKGYVAVFICMATKAIHLELVTDLSTSSFLAALRRFSARRGTPSHMYSDNGKNFVGADRILRQEYQELLKIFSEEFMKEICEMEIKWHFNAPSWPSAGGLWESAVKSFKHHFRRVIGEQKLTYEEMYTLLTQIEAVLNSRPLCPLSEDPDDMNYLTPSHFLTNGPTLTLYETERDLRTRWQLTQKIFNDLWKRWRAEYLTQLTSRSKWTRSKENIKLNDVVLIHEDNIPPGKWSMGRVVDLHPGTDGFVRVVSLKTKNGILKRPIAKLSILPVNSTSWDSNTEKTRPEQSSEPTKKQTRISTRRGLSSVIMTLLFFMITISSTYSTSNITKFRDNQGLYFDKFGDMQIIRDDWKLILYYNMEPYWEGITAINKYKKSLEQTCKTIRTQTRCELLLLQLRHGCDELEYYNQLLLGQHILSSSARLRRGLIDGVGYLANSLFGVLDARFAEQYERDITLLRTNQLNLASYWKNQTSIIEAENNVLKRVEGTISKQYKMINQHINLLDQSTNMFQSEIQNITIINEMLAGFIIGSNMLNNLKNLQSTLLDTITDIYHGRFNPHLITPKQLGEQLSTIASQLYKDVTLPIPNIHTQTNKIYKLIQSRARILEKYLIIEIRIPLVIRDTYEIFRIIPIPNRKENNMISIIPLSNYVAINLKRDTYITLSQSIINSCISFDNYLCHISSPIYNIKSDKEFCQTETSECKVSITTCKDYWIESYSPNTYIYFCCNECQLRSICGDQITTHKLTHAGIFTLDGGCTIKSEYFTLLAHNTKSSEMHLNAQIFVPVIAPINHIMNISLPTLTLSNSSEIQTQIKSIENKLEVMKNTEPLLDRITFHDVHHYTAIYICVGIIVIAALLFGWRRLRRPTQPGPAAQTAEMELAVSAVPSEAPPTASSDSEKCSDKRIKCSEFRSARYVNKATSPMCTKCNRSNNASIMIETSRL